MSPWKTPLLGLAFLQACQSPPTYSASVLSTRFFHPLTKTYTTFFINPVSDTGTSLTDFNRKRIAGTVRALLVKKGLTPGDATADLLVNIVSVDTCKVGRLAGRPLNDWYRRFHGLVDTPAFVYGALVIDIIDKDKKELIWEGVVNRPLDVPMKDPDRHIDPWVTRLLADFTPSGSSN
jgi:hypothetical protein